MTLSMVLCGFAKVSEHHQFLGDAQAHRVWRFFVAIKCIPNFMACFKTFELKDELENT